MIKSKFALEKFYILNYEEKWEIISGPIFECTHIVCNTKFIICNNKVVCINCTQVCNTKHVKNKH